MANNLQTSLALQIVAANETAENEHTERKLADYCSKYRGKGVEPKEAPKKKMRTAAETMAAKAKRKREPARPGLEIVNGQMVIRPLEIGGGFESDEEDDREEVDEDSGRSTSTYSSYTNRTRTERWGIEETRRFYSALQQCGTDFTLMLTQFPGRTQKQLKNKFRKETKDQPDLISKALDPKSAIPLNTDPYSVSLDVSPTMKLTNDDNTTESNETIELPPATDTVFDSALDAEADLVCL